MAFICPTYGGNSKPKQHTIGIVSLQKDQSITVHFMTLLPHREMDQLTWPWIITLMELFWIFQTTPNQDQDQDHGFNKEEHMLKQKQKQKKNPALYQIVTDIFITAWLSPLFSYFKLYEFMFYLTILKWHS